MINLQNSAENILKNQCNLDFFILKQNYRQTSKFLQPSACEYDSFLILKFRSSTPPNLKCKRLAFLSLKNSTENILVNQYDL